jgi:hypothetical protein
MEPDFPPQYVPSNSEVWDFGGGQGRCDAVLQVAAHLAGYESDHKHQCETLLRVEFSP